jgi:hypothetical protein
MIDGRIMGWIFYGARAEDMRNEIIENLKRLFGEIGLRWEG